MTVAPIVDLDSSGLGSHATSVGLRRRQIRYAAPVSRWLAALISLALVAAVLSPVLRAPNDDGFPLSTYPMFANPRPPQLAMTYALGETRTGALRRLRPAHLGTREVMQAVATLNRMTGASAAQRASLCAVIATHVARDAAYADVVAVRLVTGTHDAVAFLAEGARGSEATLARCEVR